MKGPDFDGCIREYFMNWKLQVQTLRLERRDYLGNLLIGSDEYVDLTGVINYSTSNYQKQSQINLGHLTLRRRTTRAYLSIMKLRQCWAFSLELCQITELWTGYMFPLDLKCTVRFESIKFKRQRKWTSRWRYWFIWLTSTSVPYQFSLQSNKFFIFSNNWDFYNMKQNKNLPIFK